MKIKTAIAAVVALAATIFSGCNTNEALIVAGANTAGNLCLSAWFAIDEPDQQVKDALKIVVEMTTEASGKIGDGGSYLDSVLPVVQELVAKQDKLKSAQKNLINTGASVLLSGLDTFICSNEEIKGNAELASKVVASFGRGCLIAIERIDGSAAAAGIKAAHKAIRMKYDVKTMSFSAGK